MSATVTDAPRRISSRDSARPIPDAPPVTNAEQPENVESLLTGSPYDTPRRAVTDASGAGVAPTVCDATRSARWRGPSLRPAPPPGAAHRRIPPLRTDQPDPRDGAFRKHVLFVFEGLAVPTGSDLPTWIECLWK
jgi:hypothetical protein